MREANFTEDDGINERRKRAAGQYILPAGIPENVHFIGCRRLECNGCILWNIMPNHATFIYAIWIGAPSTGAKKTRPRTRNQGHTEDEKIKAEILRSYVKQIQKIVEGINWRASGLRLSG